MSPTRHRFIYSALLLLAIYVLHFFLLDNFLATSATTTALRVDASLASAQVHHPHHHRHSGLAFFRMLEKHEGAKQQVSVPIAAVPRLLSCIVLFVTESPAPAVYCSDVVSLSPSSYRLYLQDRVFRI